MSFYRNNSGRGNRGSGVSGGRGSGGGSSRSILPWNTNQVMGNKIFVNGEERQLHISDIQKIMETGSFKEHSLPTLLRDICKLRLAHQDNLTLKEAESQLMQHHIENGSLVTVTSDEAMNLRVLVLAIDVSTSMEACRRGETIRYLIEIYSHHVGLPVLLIPYGMRTRNLYHTMSAEVSTMENFLKLCIRTGIITQKMITQITSNQSLREEFSVLLRIVDMIPSIKMEYDCATAIDNMECLSSLLGMLPRDWKIQFAIISDGLIDERQTSRGYISGLELLQNVISAIKDTESSRLLPLLMVVTSSLNTFNSSCIQRVVGRYFRDMPPVILSLISGKLLGGFYMVSSVDEKTYELKNVFSVMEKLTLSLKRCRACSAGSLGMSALGNIEFPSSITTVQLRQQPIEIQIGLLRALLDLVRDTFNEHLLVMARNPNHIFRRLYRLVIILNRNGCEEARQIIDTLSRRGQDEPEIRRLLDEAKQIPVEELDEMAEKLPHSIRNTVNMMKNPTIIKDIMNGKLTAEVLAYIIRCINEEGNWNGVSSTDTQKFMSLFPYIFGGEPKMIGGWRMIELVYFIVSQIRPGTEDGIPEDMHRALVILLNEFDFRTILPEDVDDIWKCPEVGKYKIQMMFMSIHNPTVNDELTKRVRGMHCLRESRSKLMEIQKLKGEAEVSFIHYTSLTQDGNDPLEIVRLAETDNGGIWCFRCFLYPSDDPSARIPYTASPVDFLFSRGRWQNDITVPHVLHEVAIHFTYMVNSSIRAYNSGMTDMGMTLDEFRTTYDSVRIRLEKSITTREEVRTERRDVTTSANGFQIIDAIVKNLQHESSEEWNSLKTRFLGSVVTFDDMLGIDWDAILSFFKSLSTDVDIEMSEIKGRDSYGNLSLLGVTVSASSIQDTLSSLTVFPRIQLVTSIIDNYGSCCGCMSNADMRESCNITTCCGQVFCRMCQVRMSRRTLDDLSNGRLMPHTCPLCRNMMDITTEDEPTELLHATYTSHVLTLTNEQKANWITGRTDFGICLSHNVLCSTAHTCGGHTAFHCHLCDEENQLSDVVRTCPYDTCGIRFERSDGCNVMVCPCGGVSCYVCGHKFIDEDHAYICGHFPNNDSFSRCRGCGGGCGSIVHPPDAPEVDHWHESEVEVEDESNDDDGYNSW